MTLADRIDYTIRRSTRARHVWLRVSPVGELVVVLPVGYDSRRVPALLKEKRKWIERTTSRVRAASADSNVLEHKPVPDSVRFEATNEKWVIHRRPTSSSLTTVRERDEGVLEIVGNTADADACRRALRRWLVRSARTRLVPWLVALGTELGFRVGRVSIRSQRTRWASCSRKRDISLNTRLLFVNTELARHVLLHELCHTRHLNHSAKFWSLLSRHDSDFARHRRELKEAWGRTPLWLLDGPERPPSSVD